MPRRCRAGGFSESRLWRRRGRFAAPNSAFFLQNPQNYKVSLHIKFLAGQHFACFSPVDAALAGPEAACGTRHAATRLALVRLAQDQRWRIGPQKFRVRAPYFRHCQPAHRIRPVASRETGFCMFGFLRSYFSNDLAIDLG
ncbi:MAG: hypothetical protein KGK15_13460, partial [Burkholderiales bacterium]|nr:hypothetical protein [Burkholderiales bacterium]